MENTGRFSCIFKLARHKKYVSKPKDILSQLKDLDMSAEDKYVIGRYENKNMT